MEWYLDKHYRIIANGGGIDAELRSLIERRPEVKEQLPVVRSTFLRQLDGAKAYRLSHEVVLLIMATAERLTGPIDISMPVPNCWIEFEQDRIGDQNLQVRAIWMITNMVHLIESPEASKGLVCHDGRWHYEQGDCISDCGRPAYVRVHNPVDGLTDISIPCDEEYPNCICSLAAGSWARIVQATGMALRAEGIERETIYREVKHAPGTRAARSVPHVSQIVHMHLSKHVIYQQGDEYESQPQTRDGPAHIVQIAEYLRHLDPQRNPRWKEDKIVIVRGHDRIIRGLPRRVVVDL